jgi:hypothetical protein
VLSLLVVPLFFLLLSVILATGRAQNTKLPDEPAVTFGITVVSSSGFKGDIYLLQQETQYLPNFKKLKPVGSVYTPALNVPPRHFMDGFPGITNRFEWFAIDYNGRFWVSKPGRYRFALQSDDGSKLYIDGKTIIDNDGIHPPAVVIGTAKLAEGVHRIRVSYFQGPRYDVALILTVSEPNQDSWRIFNTNDYRPPVEEFDSGGLDREGKPEGNRHWPK